MFKLRQRLCLGLWGGLLVGLILVGLIVLTRPGWSGEEGGLASAIGLIDWNKVTAGYKKYQTASEEFSAYREFLIETMLADRRKYALLNAGEWEEYEGLRKKEKREQKDENRLVALKTLNDQRQRELQELRTTLDPTEAQRQRKKELEDIWNATRTELEQKEEEVLRILEERNAKVSKEIMDEIQAKIAAVAQAKNLAVVLRKSVTVAPPDGAWEMTVPVVEYGGLDITDDVLKQLNEGTA